MAFALEQKPREVGDFGLFGFGESLAEAHQFECCRAHGETLSAGSSAVNAEG